MRRHRPRLGSRAPGGLRRRAPRPHGRADTRGRDRGIRDRRAGRGRRPRRARPSSGGCGRSRSRRSTATSSRRASDAVGAWEEIDFSTPLATRLDQGLVIPGDRRHRLDGRAMSATERFDVVVVGSGAGGGVVAGELADRGRRVLLLECGPHRTAADFTRWEAKANHDFWWPLRFAPINGGADGMIDPARSPVRRRDDHDQHEGRASGPRERPRQVARGERARRRQRSAVRLVRPRRRTTTASRRVSASASAPTGARASTRSSPASARSAPTSSPVRSYTDANCMSCGSCLQGCPTNAGKSTLNTYIHDAWAAGRLELRAEAPRRAGRGRGRGGSGRRVRGRRGCAPRVSTQARSSSPPGRSTRRRS